MKTILVVDDDSAVLDVVGRALEGYRVWLARDPDEGMQMAASLPTLELLVTDFLMPSMTGEELIGWLRAERPGLKVLILTGHSELLDRENPPWWAQEAHLPKPVELARLRTMVADLIGPPTPI
jgi:two-component system, cell cycle sensor histidine kinase and response regulator CckA